MSWFNAIIVSAGAQQMDDARPDITEPERDHLAGRVRKLLRWVTVTSPDDSRRPAGAIAILDAALAQARTAVADYCSEGGDVAALEPVLERLDDGVRASLGLTPES